MKRLSKIMKEIMKDHEENGTRPGKWADNKEVRIVDTLTDESRNTNETDKGVYKFKDIPSGEFTLTDKKEEDTTQK